MRQHNVLLQTLYSAKASGDKAFDFPYAIRQARSDVFFSLLFGGRIVASAGAFFDSPIAIKIFGELFTHPRVLSTCQSRDWKPLLLNTDGTEDLTPQMFLTRRWRNPDASFTLFRESDPYFSTGAPEEVLAMKEHASAYLERGEYLNFRDTLVPLFQSHDFRSALPGELRIHQTDAILGESVGDWFQSLMTYLKIEGTFLYRRHAPNPEELQKFSPMDAVTRRTHRLGEDAGGPYEKAELIRLNREFVKLTNNSPLMNPYHIHGPAHYGPEYYPLINHWIEAEWHQTRQRMYNSDVCILSSDRRMRELFDFDNASMVSYVSDAVIDDSLRVVQEDFCDIDWSILLDVVTDTQWLRLVDEIHASRSADALKRPSEEMLHLLSKKMTDFTFDHAEGKVSIIGRRLAKIAAVAGYGGVTAKLHDQLHSLLGLSLELGGAISTLMATDTVVKAASPLLKHSVAGLRHVYNAHQKGELRRAIIPNGANIYVA